MPWTQAQHRLFQAAAHNPAIAASRGMTQGKAAHMASEGVKGKGKHYAAAIRRKTANGPAGSVTGTA